MDKYPKSNLKYVDEDDEVAALYIDICESKDIELYNTYRFY